MPLHKIEAFLQKEAKKLGLVPIDGTILYIILDWIDRMRDLSKIGSDKS